MVEGIIVRGVGGFYYVNTDDGIIECRARGLFREENQTPLVGDKVRIRLNPEDGSGYIEEILPRKNQLIRPPVANITQAIIVMSIKDPILNPWLLDRLLVMVEKEKIKVTICINKSELKTKEADKIVNIYRDAGYNIIRTSAETGEGIELLRNELRDNISIFAGPSGVGKSSLLNKIDKNLFIETGKISKKTRRGKHTTRHVELFKLDDDSFVLDSPGFGSLNLDFLEDESQLRGYFKEINKYGKECKFVSCLHVNEPGCEVKRLVEDGIINGERYKNYLNFLEELKNIRRY
ncbi:MAG: ribosome small subunit-dependent GTPase A [Tissierellaceae bacterium]|nr:ribosome small subunit-dependent GTPase A [Tissierellaceae bacterium]